MKPVGNRVIAEKITEMKTASGLVIPMGEAQDQVTGDVRKAKVVSSNSPEVQVGDLILYSRFVGTPFGDNLIVLDAKDILAVEE